MLPVGAQENYDNFIYSWKDAHGLNLNNELKSIEDEKRRHTQSQQDRAPEISAHQINQHPLNKQYKTLRFKSMMYKNEN